ncbi:MAG: FHA domain-containing protein [Candidatus Aminicenantes bacterium]|nr:FHA domain-containing protein [Candidatus Aminicenantes bacterium]
MDQSEEKQAYLEGITGLYNGNKYLIAGDEFVIGRSPDCDLIMKESTISAQHAKITRTGDVFEIIDLGSINKTSVNGENVERKRLRTADKIRLDVVEFTFINPGDVVRTELSSPDPGFDLPKTVIRSEPADTQTPNSEKTHPLIREDIKTKPDRPARKGNLFNGLVLGLLIAYILSWGGLLLSVLMQNRLSSASITGLFRGQMMVFPLLHLHTHWLNIAHWTPPVAVSLICLVMGLFIGGIIARDIGRYKRSNTALIFSVVYILIAAVVQLAALQFDFTAWQNLARGAGLGMGNPLLNLILVMAYFWVVSFIISFMGTLLGKK